MIDRTVLEVLFMGFEGETSGFEAFNAVRKMENLDANAAVVRVCDILRNLAANGLINLWLGDPYMRDPDPRPGDPEGVDIVTRERVQSMDEPDGRMLVYEITSQGESVVETEMGVKRSHKTASD